MAPLLFCYEKYLKNKKVYLEFLSVSLSIILRMVHYSNISTIEPGA